MRALNEKHVYDLSELTSEELKNIWNYLMKNEEAWEGCPFEEMIRHQKKYRLVFGNYGWYWSDIIKPTSNAKELFYTLENIQVDCRNLTEGQIKEMTDVFEKNGYNLDLNGTTEIHFYLRLAKCEASVDLFSLDDTKTTITYEKFMELFSRKEENFKKLVEVLNEELLEEAYKETEYEVKYIAEKPKQYQIGIDTFNPQPHYNNENGSLYKIANDLGLNHWEFDIFKRLVRCRKKNQFKEDLQKIKDTIDIYLNEFTDEK